MVFTTIMTRGAASFLGFSEKPKRVQARTKTPVVPPFRGVTKKGDGLTASTANGNLDSGIDAGTPRGPRPKERRLSQGRPPFLVIKT